MYTNRTANKFIVSQQQKAQSYDVGSTFSGISEEFNLNAHYLKEIGFVIEEWRLLHLYGIQNSTNTPDYYDRAVRILDALLDLLSPKIKSEEINKYNKWIRNFEFKASGMFQNQEKGLFLDKSKAPKVKYIMRLIYRYLLLRIEQKGMLTKLADDPTKAIMELE